MVRYPAQCRESDSLVVTWPTDKLSSLEALMDALSNLDTLCETIETAYLTSLQHDKYERWQEKS